MLCWALRGLLARRFSGGKKGPFALRTRTGHTHEAQRSIRIGRVGADSGTAHDVAEGRLRSIAGRNNRCLVAGEVDRLCRK
jgi:hypothetical protein